LAETAQRARITGLSVLGVLAVLVALAASAVVPDLGLHHVAQFATNALYFVVGSIIVLRSRQQLIGWLLVALGFFFMVGVLVFSLEERAIVDPGFIDSATLQRFESPSSLGVSVLFLLILVFPTGHLLSRGWRWVVVAIFVVAFALGVVDWVEAASGREIVAEYAWVMAMAGLFAVAATSLIVRFRRGGPVERRQIGWLAYGVFVAISMYVITALVGPSEEVFLVVDAVASALTPLAILIAITKYRLYDLDRLVNRTVVYGIVIGGLTALYAVIVSLSAVVLPTTDNDFAIVASVLLAAAAFNPLRRRVQRFVDRRFYRSRYNAQRIAQTFSSRVSDEVDAKAITQTWIDIVTETMQPEAIGVWIKHNT